MGARGITPFADQAKAKASQIVSTLEDNVQYSRELAGKPISPKQQKHWTTMAEGYEEDLRRVHILIGQINVPFEASGLKPTAYTKRQRELGKQILGYNKINLKIGILAHNF